MEDIIKKTTFKASRSLRGNLQATRKELRRQLRKAPPRLKAATDGYLKAGGKNLRAALLLLAAMVGGYQGEKAVKAATAVEIIHLASLIHDDILDNADTRRGFPTINITYGFKHAATTGDYLFGLAFHILTDIGDQAIIKPLAKAAMELSLGELIELEDCRRWSQSEDDYLKRINYKTASLFKAACRIGAICGGLSAAAVDKLTAYGGNLGMAFQIYDDILDITGDKEAVGKPVGNDLREGIITLPVIIGLKGDKREIIKAAVNKPVRNHLEPALRALNSSGATAAAKDKARVYLERAEEIIKKLPPAPVINELKAISDFVIERYN